MSDFWKNINKPITVLAPMEGVTDIAFREIISRIAKPDVMFTEFTCAEGLCSKGKKSVARKLAYTENQRPVVAQIWGCDPDSFTKAAQYVKEQGFDGIDINMGCPDKAVVKKGGGAALIHNINLAKELINAVKNGAPELPLSIKTRIDDTKDLTEQWLSFLLSQKIDAITLHARTAKELSKVPVNWEEIGKAVELKNKINPEVTIIGNGDIRSYKEIVEKHKIYGVDGVMVGRGIFHDPWLFEKNETSKAHNKQEYLELLKEHAKLFDDNWGKSQNFEVMKKFFKVYIKDFNGAGELRQQLMGTKSYKEFCNIINNQKVTGY